MGTQGLSKAKNPGVSAEALIRPGVPNPKQSIGRRRRNVNPWEGGAQRVSPRNSGWGLCSKGSFQDFRVRGEIPVILDRLQVEFDGFLNMGQCLGAGGTLAQTPWEGGTKAV
jgi:hypothetical protein